MVCHTHIPGNSAIPAIFPIEILMPKPTKEEIKVVTQGFIDKGLLIEAGWVSLRMMAVAPNASQLQIDEMRMAFFAGAHHLFASIMTALEPDAEPTEADLRRMDLIHNELEEYLKNFKAKHGIA